MDTIVDHAGHSVDHNTELYDRILKKLEIDNKISKLREAATDRGLPEEEATKSTSGQLVFYLGKKAGFINDPKPGTSEPVVFVNWGAQSWLE